MKALVYHGPGRRTIPRLMQLIAGGRPDETSFTAHASNGRVAAR